MSTISTHLNWGSSYIVNDWYLRFVKPEATQKELVWVGRVSTVILMVVAALIALCLTNALQAFGILLQIGAGTGLLFIMRWFWWRINALSELTAMVVSFLVALFFFLQHKLIDIITKTLVQGGTEVSEAALNAKQYCCGLEGWQELIVGVAITTIAWVLVTLLTKPSEDKVLRNFCRLINPAGPGWKPVFEKAEADGQRIEPVHSKENLPLGILCMFLGCSGVYSIMFATGYWIYGETKVAIITTLIALVASVALIVCWGKMTEDKCDVN